MPRGRGEIEPGLRWIKAGRPRQTRIRNDKRGEVVPYRPRQQPAGPGDDAEPRPTYCRRSAPSLQPYRMPRKRTERKTPMSSSAGSPRSR